jgi:hypothetical protein
MYLVEDEDEKVGRKFVFVGNGMVEDKCRRSNFGVN